MQEQALTTGGTRRTDPAVGFASKGFVYVPAAGTDIRKRFERTDPNWALGPDPAAVTARRREARRQDIAFE